MKNELATKANSDVEEARRVIRVTHPSSKKVSEWGPGQRLGRQWAARTKFRGGESRAGAAPPCKFLNLTENCCPSRLTSKKMLRLHSWRLFDCKSYIQCTSPSRSKIQYMYVHFHEVNKQLIERRVHSGSETVNETVTQSTWKSKKLQWKSWAH